MHAHNPTSSPGFTATKPTATLNTSATLTGFSASPAESMFPECFDPATGKFTAPESGVYFVSAVLNFKFPGGVTASIEPGADPKLSLMLNGGEERLAGYFPMVSINHVLFYIRTTLGNGTVHLSGTVKMEQGEVAYLYYDADGLTLSFDVGSSSITGLSWSMYKIY